MTVESMRIRKVTIDVTGQKPYSFYPVRIEYHDGSHERVSMQLWRIHEILERAEQDAGAGK